MIKNLIGACRTYNKASWDSSIWYYADQAYLDFLIKNNKKVFLPVRSVTVTYCARTEQKKTKKKKKKKKKKPTTTKNQEIICSRAKSFSPKLLLGNFWMHISLSNNKIFWVKHQYLTPTQMCSSYTVSRKMANTLTTTKTFSVILIEKKLTFSNPEITH